VTQVAQPISEIADSSVKRSWPISINAANAAYRPGSWLANESVALGRNSMWPVAAWLFSGYGITGLLNALIS